MFGPIVVLFVEENVACKAIDHIYNGYVLYGRPKYTWLGLSLQQNNLESYNIQFFRFFWKVRRSYILLCHFAIQWAKIDSLNFG